LSSSSPGSPSVFDSSPFRLSRRIFSVGVTPGREAIVSSVGVAPAREMRSEPDAVAFVMVTFAATAVASSAPPQPLSPA
jgi:hypothetical protein